MSKIGLMGGTFDPIHNGHLYLAREAQKQLGLDEVWWIVSGDPPHKGEDVRTRIARRHMVEMSIRGLDGMKLCDVELLRDKEGYTCETLEILHQMEPETEFYFIMGEDSLRSFGSWYHPERIAALSNIAVALRYDEQETKEQQQERTVAIRKTIEEMQNRYPTEYVLLHTRNIPISSSMIRQMIAKQEDIGDYVPGGVLAYIRERHLYENTLPQLPHVEDVLQKLQSKLKPSRYTHTIGVMETAAALAMRYSYPVDRARIAGALHDCAKGHNEKQLLALCRKYHLPVTAAEEASLHLLHAKVGAYMARHDYHVSDEEICHAIAVHTTGEPGMGLLDQIVFVADYIEPNRNKARRLREIREVAFYDLNLAVRMILCDTVEYLKKQGAKLDEKTIDTYQYYEGKDEYIRI